MDPRRLNRLLIGPPFLFFIAHNATRHEYMELKGACRVLCAPDLSRTTTLIAHNAAQCEYISPLERTGHCALRI
jgi:hypothetical protein